MWTFFNLEPGQVILAVSLDQRHPGRRFVILLRVDVLGGLGQVVERLVRQAHERPDERTMLKRPFRAGIACEQPLSVEHARALNALCAGFQ